METESGHAPAPTPPAEHSTPPATTSPTRVTPIFGVTTDSVENIAGLTKSLFALTRKPTVRVVFDYPTSARHYEAPIAAIARGADVLGELLDSYYMSNVNCRKDLNYKQRVADYINNPTLARDVDIWEIGNEVNGEWLCHGNPNDVYWAMRQAYESAKAAKKRTALTLFYYTAACAGEKYEMFNWIDSHIEDDMRLGLDYVMISYYETACWPHDPWEQVFSSLAQRFPNSWLAFGEVGTEDENEPYATKHRILHRYYGLAPMHPRFVGGFFWWYFRQDMVPVHKPLWTDLNELARSWEKIYQ